MNPAGSLRHADVLIKVRLTSLDSLVQPGLSHVSFEF
jgi:hypothetical protein